MPASDHEELSPYLRRPPRRRASAHQACEARLGWVRHDQGDGPGRRKRPSAVSGQLGQRHMTIIPCCFVYTASSPRDCCLTLWCTTLKPLHCRADGRLPRSAPASGPNGVGAGEHLLDAQSRATWVRITSATRCETTLVQYISSRIHPDADVSQTRSAAALAADSASSVYYHRCDVHLLVSNMFRHAHPSVGIPAESDVRIVVGLEDPVSRRLRSSLI